MSAAIVPEGDAVPKEESSPDKKICKGCGNKIPIPAVVCKDCKSPQTEKACCICGTLIPATANYCNACKGFQDWRRRIPGDQVALALLVAILSLVGTLVPQILKFINLPSRTSGFFLESKLFPETEPPYTKTHSVLTVRLTNEGGRPAQVEGARIDFGDAGLTAVPDLEIVDRAASVVPLRDKSDVKLFAYDLVNPPTTQDQIDRVALQLCKAEVNIFVSVRERSRVFGALLPARDLDPIRVPARTALAWFVERVTPHPTKEPC